MEDQEHKDFERLFREHYKSLFDLACNLVHDRDLAKDAVQEVFVKLWKNRGQVEFGPAIRNYLFKATAHTCLNHLRSGRKILHLDDISAVSQLAAQSGTEDVHYQELESKARRAIENLPARCRVIYLLSRQEGLKYSEIADALNISVKTVENQMGIALEKLREDLKPFLTREFLAIVIALSYLLYSLAL